MANNTLIVGASGGIGQALVKQYAQTATMFMRLPVRPKLIRTCQTTFRFIP